MSRFTEHFDFDTTQYMHTSPSKSSFLSSYSSEDLSIQQGRLKNMYPLLTNSYSSFDSDHTTSTKSSTTSCSSRTNSEPCSPITPNASEEQSNDYMTSLHSSEEKALSSKLKRLLTTMSIKKKRPSTATASLYASSTA